MGKQKKFSISMCATKISACCKALWNRLMVAIKVIYKIIMRIFAATVLLPFVVVPFLSECLDHKYAQWLWYTACVLFVGLLVIDRCRRKEPTFKTPIFEFYSRVGEVAVLPVMASVFVFNYYNIDQIWLWVIFVLAAIGTPCYFISLYAVTLKQEDRSETEKKNGALNTCKYILLYWLYDLFYMAIFNEWPTLIYLFGIVAIVIIFYNLAVVFLKGVKNLQYFLPFDLLFGIGLTVYLIYIVPDENLRNIILTITASVLGGLLALVGVAWTIRHTNELRQEDMMRLENERREDERKKHVPYIRISFNKELPPIVVNAHIRNGIDFSNPDELAALKGTVYFSINVPDFNIKNVSSGNIIIKGVYLHQKYYSFEQVEIVEPGACCRVCTTNNYWVAMPEPQKSITLILGDILGNDYEVVCPVTYGRDSVRLKSVATIGDKEYIGYDYSYIVSSADLPVLIKDDM